ncbi:unnamed protein product [Thelazia callipaeda]|uniref:Uncharacterized protein n=1 Tax=Thelazia callipaeda TaxID=103827 RepID=A0A0N5CQL4_THECL|nr:unnamed protein product [Thelazia callipaeda]
MPNTGRARRVSYCIERRIHLKQWNEETEEKMPDHFFDAKIYEQSLVTLLEEAKNNSLLPFCSVRNCVCQQQQASKAAMDRTTTAIAVPMIMAMTLAKAVAPFTLRTFC